MNGRWSAHVAGFSTRTQSHWLIIREGYWNANSFFFRPLPLLYNIIKSALSNYSCCSLFGLNKQGTRANAEKNSAHHTHGQKFISLTFIFVPKRRIYIHRCLRTYWRVCRRRLESFFFFYLYILIESEPNVYMYVCTTICAQTAKWLKLMCVSHI